MTNIPNQRLLDVLGAYPGLSLGTDISKHQGDVNFQTLKSRAIHFAAFRATIGDYYTDPMRETYYLNAKAENIHQTDYHVLRPDNSAKSQMDNYFNSRPSGDTPPDWPVVLDNEIHGKDVKVTINKKKFKWVWKKFPPAQITDRLLECKEIILERDGIMPIHYSYLYFLLERMEDAPEVWEMDLWLAHYQTLKPGWISGRNRLAPLNGGKGVPIVIWQCLADGDDQGPYFGSEAHGLDINLFMQGGNDEFDKRYLNGEPAPPPEPTEAIMLNIPYKSQKDPDANVYVNDCGPTCVAMILNAHGLNVTTDEVYKKTGAPANKYVTISQMINAAEAYGFPFEHFYSWNIDQLKLSVDEGEAVIALVHYGAWSKIEPGVSTQSSFTGPHFVVVVGYDDEYIYVNDPLWGGDRRGEGERKRWTYAEFNDAWGSAHKDGNRDYSGIVCTIPLDEDPPSPPLSSAIHNQALDEGIEALEKLKI